MSKISPINVDEHSQSFIEAQIARGAYRDPNEVVQAGLRLLEERDGRIAALRDALIEGEDSGPPEAFDLEDFIAEMNGNGPKVA